MIQWAAERWCKEPTKKVATTSRLDSITGGHLEFVRGATNVTIHAASRMETTWLEEGPMPEQSAPSGRHR